MLYKTSKYNLIALIFILCIFISTYICWPGSKNKYLIFSISFSLLLYFSLKRRPSVGYVFLAVVLWIGFWLKLSIHILDPKLPWMEPTGLFDFSNQAWDEVALVSSIGAFAVLISGFFFPALSGKLKPGVIYKNSINNVQSILWMVGLCIVLFLVIFNEGFDIAHQAVPPPVLNLPFHLQGLINWGLGGGVFLLLMIPLYSDAISGNLVRGVGLIVIAALAISISLFSRGSVVFQSLTILIPFFVYSVFLFRPSVNQVLKCAVIIILGVSLSVVLSQSRRVAFFASVQSSPAQSSPTLSSPTKSSAASTFLNFDSYSLFLILKLPIERWIGLEGVMAMSAHPKKDFELLIRAINEPRLIGALDMYTHEIALSPVKDITKATYATPPSLFAFWYYSGNLFIVFIGVVFLTILLLGAEYITMLFSKNPFLSSAVGMQGAIQIVHIGTGGLFIPALIFIVTLIVAILIGGFSQCRVFKIRVNDVYR